MSKLTINVIFSHVTVKENLNWKGSFDLTLQDSSFMSLWTSKAFLQFDTGMINEKFVLLPKLMSSFLC